MGSSGVFSVGLSLVFLGSCRAQRWARAILGFHSLACVFRYSSRERSHDEKISLQVWSRDGLLLASV